MTKNPSSPYGWEFINDLSAVNGDEESIIEFLLHRLGREEIYTWVGPLLLVVNPGKNIIRDLFDESQKRAFISDGNICLEKPRPHIYAVASKAQYMLINGLGKICQVIVISGESGTGKTFNARKALEFLASSNVTLSGSENSPEVSQIVHKIGNVFPLLSAFSTASTENNERSSRHGQLLRLQYDENGVIRGASIKSFLLERTRVTAGSNNFEIFYQLIVGLTDLEIEELRLNRQGNYDLLGDFNETKKEPRFYEGFRETIEAFDALGFNEQSKMDVFRVIALLMHLGNIKFRHKFGEGCTIDMENEESRKALTNACSLISLPEEELNDLLTSILICPNNLKRRHTSYRRELKTVDDCRNRLFSIARYLYERLFQWIVARVNETLTINEKNYDWLGILDIFGFESFEINGLEQLSINYTTERLQLYFMEDYLEAGQRELEEEGLEELPPSFAIQIYRERLSAIETIVFATFNDACQSPIPPCLSSLRQQFLSKEKATRFFKIRNDVFVIKHYSRSVTYNVDNLLSKNTDKVPTELSTAFNRCKNKLLRSLSEVDEENVYGIACKVSLKKCTALGKLKQSLDCLVKELKKCDSHYVRCTRPRNVDGSWVKNEFRQQLACTGILDALPLARCKFPIKFTYEEFYKRYSIKRGDEDCDLLCKLNTIINSLNINSSMLHLGKRLLFITENLFFALEKYRKNHRKKCAEKIQSFWLRTRKSKKAKAQNIFESTQNRNREISHNDIPKSSQSSSENDDVFTEKLQSVQENRKNISISGIEKIDEQSKNISQVSIVVTKASQSSNEEEDVFTKKLQSVEENRQKNSIFGGDEINEELKNISQVSVVVPESSQNSSGEVDIFGNKLQPIEENRQNTSSPISEIVDVQSKDISQAFKIITKPSIEEDDIFNSTLQSAEDHENNNDPIDEKRAKLNMMKTVKVSENIAEPSADTGYCSTGEKSSLEKIGSQISREEFQIAEKSLESTRELLKIADITEYYKPHSEIGCWKEFYLRNWLESTPSDSEEDSSIFHGKISNKFNKKYSQSQILRQNSTLKIQSNELELFYRNRILSRRRPVEIPIKFHTRLTCLRGSHRLPFSMKPRGLEDCLNEEFLSVKYIGCKDQ